MQSFKNMAYQKANHNVKDFHKYQTNKHEN